MKRKTNQKKNALEILPDSTESNPYDILGDKEKLAVELALVNMPYSLIAIRMKRKHQTIKDWFAKGGKLHDAYVYMKRETLKEFKRKRKEIDKQIQDGAVEAIAGLRVDARRTGLIGNITRRDILDRAGFKATDKIKHSNDPDNPILGANVNIYIPDNGRDKDEGKD
jgi:hypothetical protein